MTLNIAVCDDDSGLSENVVKAVKTWADLHQTDLHQTDEHRCHVNFSCYSSAEEFLFHYSERKKFDILLLDIEMKKINGVELARTVRRENKEVQIIFITGYMEYIADGYEVEALHYLLKPLDTEKLYSVLNRAVEKLRHNEQAVFITCGDESVRIPLYQIRFVEVQRNYITVHADTDYSVKKTLGEFEKELNESFFRVGRSFIVNLKYIRKITKVDIYLSDGMTIPLPRGVYDSLNRAMINYF